MPQPKRADPLSRSGSTPKTEAAGRNSVESFLRYPLRFMATRLNAWRVIGPGGAGGMLLPTVSPHDPRLVLERCDMTGSYISHDAGHSWRMFNLRDATSAFAFDPGDARVIYAGSHALFRSE